MYYTLLGLFLLSRFFFINPADVFFDSGENIYLFNYSDFFLAMVSGHFPPHEGYILIAWPIFQLAKLLNFHPVASVIFGQTILATLIIVCFYKVLVFITDKKQPLSELL